MTFPPLPRVHLGHLPTPLEPLERLSERLGGPPIYVKRDDCTGLALGGNKTRKLEFLCADALERGADTLVTAGGLQSNHVRQTAAAAAKLGLVCHLVLQRYVARDEPAYRESGNLLLDDLLGARLHFPPSGASRDEEMARLAGRLEAEGARPYVIPGGGSNAVGGLGYAAAVGEILEQARDLGIEVGAVVFATASGGTQAGLLAGFAHARVSGEVVGVSVDAPDPALAEHAAAVTEGTAELLGLGDRDLAARIEIVEGYGGEGYGVPTSEMAEAVRLLARLEGIVLDPVYTGKAMAGLIDLVGKGRFDPRRAVVFLHSGGLPGLFAYPSLFPPRVPETI